MPTIAEQNRKDTDLMYTLLQEGKLDLMYLPSGVIAWLWDRPESQVNAARDLAVAAKDTCPVTDGAVLRSDQNILILKCEDGHKFNVYPDGGYGCDGESLDIHGCMKMLDQGMMQSVPDEECPMEDSSHTSGDQPDAGPYMTNDALASEVSQQTVMVPEDEGESVLDHEKEKRGTDLICKMRSVGNPLAKALKGSGKKDSMTDEALGGASQGMAGPIGTDMFDFEDEIPEIEAMVAEQLDQHARDRVYYDTVTIDLDDEETGAYLNDFPVEVAYTVWTDEYHDSMGQKRTEHDIEIQEVTLGGDLEYMGKRYKQGMPFPGWMMKHIPFNVMNRKNPGESDVDVFHSYLDEKIRAQAGG